MSPAILGIDTSGAWCSAALLRGPESFVRRAEVGSAHSTHLLAMIDAVLADAALGLDGCAAIAFAAGPGSFTGLRVAAAVAQGLAFGADLRVAPIGTLAAIAHSTLVEACADGARSILVAQDARMGELYWARFDVVGGRLVPVAGPALAVPARLRDDLAALRGDAVDVGCGNGWVLHAAALSGAARRVVARDSADAVDVAALGLLALEAGQLVAPELAAPLYVRNDVARTTAQREAAAQANLR